MSLRTLWRELERTLTSWEEVECENLPEWVKKRKPVLGSFEYTVFKGNHYLYKIWNTAEVQGGSYRFYRKKRIY